MAIFGPNWPIFSQIPNFTLYFDILTKKNAKKMPAVFFSVDFTWNRPYARYICLSSPPFWYYSIGAGLGGYIDGSTGQFYVHCFVVALLHIRAYIQRTPGLNA